jgi:hypothetical protein
MATFLTDTFTDTNAVALTSHTGETGATWTTQTGQTGIATIQTNRIYHSGGGRAVVQASGTPASADYDVTATLRLVSGVNGDVGVIGRASTSANTFYTAYVLRSGTTYQIALVRCVAGTLTALTGTNFVGITAPTVGTDHTLTLRMVGSAISAYWDGVLTTGPLTDTNITAAGKAGTFSDIVVTTTTGFHVADVNAVDLVTGKSFVRMQAVNRASTY